MTRKLVLLLIVFSSQATIFGQKVLWKFKTNDRVYTAAHIIDEVLYFGSGDCNFYALDKNTGAKICAYKTDGPIHSSASGYKNSVYFSSSDGNLYALDKTNGNLLWKFSSDPWRLRGILGPVRGISGFPVSHRARPANFPPAP